MQALHSFMGTAAPFRTARSSTAPVARPSLMVSAATVAAPVALPVKKLDGSDVGSSASISLRVADEDTANGLVHRYLVMVRQNARQVRVWGRPCMAPSCCC